MQIVYAVRPQTLPEVRKTMSYSGKLTIGADGSMTMAHWSLWMCSVTAREKLHCRCKRPGTDSRTTEMHETLTLECDGTFTTYCKRWFLFYLPGRCQKWAAKSRPWYSSSTRYLVPHRRSASIWKQGIRIAKRLTDRSGSPIRSIAARRPQFVVDCGGLGLWGQKSPTSVRFVFLSRATALPSCWERTAAVSKE
ncbi:hypothetical protein K461DRAFT_21461 [Myriangium duriaei CBS 260.36]|uniref:Uncharacterized protein n=1 Tax=Myriangium duriaei CBS 260.36 TaxID=1168546 RepID=A0A9P4JEY3_9PEZI|nr:hypothetical protein K461DRAFT_21461 [Myriangium duriaei CBS 260.36]